jgi:IclR family transcriptional regulator, acetate operon repressor
MVDAGTSESLDNECAAAGYERFGAAGRAAAKAGRPGFAPGPDAAERRQVDGVPRILVLGKMRAVLDAFTPEQPELTISDLVARTSLPTSTCTRIVRNLSFDGILERVGDSYRIGIAVVRWARLAIEGRDLISVAAPVLTRLRDQTGETVQLCIRDGRFTVVTAAVVSTHRIARQLRVGEVSYVHAGSVGKTFLAFDPGAFATIENSAVEAFTERTIVDLAQLADQAERIRRAGYAVSFGERSPGAAGVSAPILDRGGTAIAAVGISGPFSRITPDNVEHYVGFVRAAANEISVRAEDASFGSERP